MYVLPVPGHGPLINSCPLTGDDWTDCFRVDGISLPTSPYLGVSALTGEVFDAHEYVLALRPLVQPHSLYLCPASSRSRPTRPSFRPRIPRSTNSPAPADASVYRSTPRHGSAFSSSCSFSSGCASAGRMATRHTRSAVDTAHLGAWVAWTLGIDGGMPRGGGSRVDRIDIGVFCASYFVSPRVYISVGPCAFHTYSMSVTCVGERGMLEPV